MKRRAFIVRTALTTCSIPVLFPMGCRPPEQPPARTGPAFPLQEYSIAMLQQKMTQGEFTSAYITSLYLERIASIDKDGPQLNSVIELNPDAISIAQEADKARARGDWKGPLHGIPFLLKDNIDTSDRMMTTAGSLAMAGHYARKDASIVRQLRDAGAVLLGKTNLSEWANFRSTRSSSGWSSRGGQTKNPYNPDRNPCGSSSGSGVAVAANLCAFAIGTETNGSIACPASINGIVGLKPTVGLVSRTGIIPISVTQDTAGPMARTVADVAVVLAAMTAKDERDNATATQPEVPRDYAPYLDAAALKGKRIGVEKSFLKGHERVDVLLEKALDQMKENGATIVEVELVDHIRGIGADEFKVLEYEFKNGLNRYLSTANAPVKSLEDIISFNEKNAATAMPHFQQEILESSQAKKGLDESEYRQALKNILDTSRQILDGLINSHNLDAICGPANGPAWCTDLVNGDHFTGYGMYSAAAIAGYPSITVPMGDVAGLPVGLSFISKPYAEGPLMAIAYAYEQHSRNRRAPEFPGDE